MNNLAVVTLPRGYWAEDVCSREATLRELNGADQVFLVEECGEMLPAQWVTEMLARCVIRFGNDHQVTRDTIRSLTVGDREALLLHLRRLSFGDQLQCMLVCPARECGERLDIELNVRDLLVAVEEKPQPDYEFALRNNDSCYAVRFRLPTGRDQEAAAHVALNDVPAAADLLLQTCIQSASSPEGPPVMEFTENLGDRLAERMRQLDPQAEITLNVTCSICSQAFEVLFDTAGYLFKELQSDVRTLYREVHLLAYHYHWGLSEILGLSGQIRRRFLGLLSDELTAQSS